ncbi:MAG: hypothetical protein Q8K48_08435 [Candidatus Planktophila sp.]|nr:hypothetical protein [Candidatus Planktophila sp.]
MSDRKREPLGKFAPENINDHILHVIFELAAELWVVKRRLAEIEGSAIASGTITNPDSIIRDESFAFDNSERDAFVERIFRSLKDIGVKLDTQ